MRAIRIIWFALKYFTLLLGLSVIALIILLFVAAPWDRSPDIPDSAALVVTLPDELGEKPDGGGFASLISGRSLSVHRLSRIIEHAAGDDRIQALIVDLTASSLAHAQAEQLAQAMAAWRASGKPSYAYSTSWDLRRYRLGAAFGEIWMPASGDFAVGGIAMQFPYAGELVEDLGILPQLERRKRYKSAADVIAEERMSPVLRVALTEFTDDMYRSALDAIAALRPRSGSAEALPQALETAFWSPEAALAQKLVDRLDHLTVLSDLVDLPHVTAMDYLPEALQEPPLPAARIAFITATGEIREGKSSPLESGTIASRTLVAILREASEDQSIDAILLRVDSPGGGYAPSDAIARTIAAIEKPVVVSMGAVAGSGGYMIAMNADRIVAHPSTITGSIGVIGGKIVVEDLLFENGVRIESVESGRHGAVGSPFTRYTPHERALLSRRIDAIYDAFKSAVAGSRNLTPEAIEAAAQGRIWTGDQAAGLGLVDRIGGIGAALAETARLLDIDDAARLSLVEYPELSTAQRLLHAADLGVVQARALLGWSDPVNKALENVEAHPVIRAEMPAYRLD